MLTETLTRGTLRQMHGRYSSFRLQLKYGPLGISDSSPDFATTDMEQESIDLRPAMSTRVISLKITG